MSSLDGDAPEFQPLGYLENLVQPHGRLAEADEDDFAGGPFQELQLQLPQDLIRRRLAFQLQVVTMESCR